MQYFNHQTHTHQSMITETNHNIIKNHSCAFTVDVEDGVSIAMRDAFGIESPQTDRVVTNTERILTLLEQHNTIATFFILGKVAEDFPELIKKISNAGHEVGVHGYNHLQFFRMTPIKAYEELMNAKKRLEDLTGNAVTGHRAPAFSITPKTAWGLDVIAKCGFSYDSSIMPIKAKQSGWNGFPKDIVKVLTKEHNSLIEVPVSTVKLLGLQIPFSGGSYFRLLPFSVSKKAFAIHSKVRPTIHYMHPYELDVVAYPDYYFDALKQSSWLKELKMRSYWVNRNTIYNKLEQLLPMYSFTTMSNVIKDYKDNGLLKTIELL